MTSTDVSAQIKSQVTDAALVQRRQQQIAAAAVELFSAQGYDRTTVQQVARKAGVSIGLIYQYVQDKEDILLLSILDVIDTYRAEIPAALAGLEDPLLRFHAAVSAYCHVVDARREATVLTYRSTKSLPPAHRKVIKAAEIDTNRLLSDCIRGCIDAGLFREVDVEFVTYQLVMFAHAWALKHWSLAGRYTLEQYIEQGFSLYMTACLTEEGWRRARAILPVKP
ncbi:MAG TPA: TetR/AcrR family transcriptional regulator [Azospirillum sp.]|nr:TetR/AcrR family transcriptional regulator [Azospirillum sp.]